MRLTRFKLIVAFNEGVFEQRADLRSAHRQRVHEIGAHQSWLRGVPFRHRTSAAHRLERIEERAAGFRGGLLLDFDNPRQDRNCDDGPLESRSPRSIGLMMSTETPGRSP